MKTNEKKIISVVGATATGKTALSIALAKHFHTSILSFDSRQCYKELNIGTAKPSLTERQGIPHDFIDSHSIFDTLTVKDFTRYAQEKIKRVLDTHSTIILVGGTGLFWTALHYGLDDIPAVPSAIRKEIQTQYEQGGLAWLQQKLQEEDPRYASCGEMQNPQRMMRALEVVRHLGMSIKAYQTGRTTALLPYPFFSVGLHFADANERRRIIAQRVRQMIEKGLKDEVALYQNYAHLPSMKTVGYQEWMPYFAGQASEQEVEESMVKNTVYYAKRQMTWFKRYAHIQWFCRDSDTHHIIAHIEKQCNNL